MEWTHVIREKVVAIGIALALPSASIILAGCTGGGAPQSRIENCGTGAAAEAVVGNRCIGVDDNNKS